MQFTYLPRPEEVARHVHSIHAGQDELLDAVLHILCPGRPIIPRTAI